MLKQKFKSFEKKGPKWLQLTSVLFLFGLATCGTVTYYEIILLYFIDPNSLMYTEYICC